jgi:hypothetical protein
VTFNLLLLSKVNANSSPQQYPTNHQNNPKTSNPTPPAAEQQWENGSDFGSASQILALGFLLSLANLSLLQPYLRHHNQSHITRRPRTSPQPQSNPNPPPPPFPTNRHRHGSGPLGSDWASPVFDELHKERERGTEHSKVVRLRAAWSPRLVSCPPAPIHRYSSKQARSIFLVALHYY